MVSENGVNVGEIGKIGEAVGIKTVELKGGEWKRVVRKVPRYMNDRLGQIV
jgi:hypothetical protein